MCSLNFTILAQAKYEPNSEVYSNLNIFTRHIYKISPYYITIHTDLFQSYLKCAYLVINIESKERRAKAVGFTMFRVVTTPPTRTKKPYRGAIGKNPRKDF